MRARRHKGPVGRREFEIKDADPFDKDIRPRHALNAHLLREPPPCYTRCDLSLGHGRCR